MSGRKKCSENEKRLRNKLSTALRLAIGDDRGAISRAAKKTGVSKQSLSLYLRQLATPTPETLRILCSGLKFRLDIEGAVISASDIVARRIRQAKAIQLPLSLSDVISSVAPDRLKVQILDRRATSIELKVSIGFEAEAKRIRRNRA